ncbi:MAG: hypothetical protein ACFE9L_18295 [Candidatus Hodarchaeota archaeon]
MGSDTDMVYKCPECDQVMVRIFSFYLCNFCDVVRDKDAKDLLKTYLWKPECIRVKYDFLYTALLAKRGKATLEDLLKQIERRPLEHDCDERVGMPLTVGIPEPEEHLQELYKAYQKLSLEAFFSREIDLRLRILKLRMLKQASKGKRRRKKRGIKEVLKEEKDDKPSEMNMELKEAFARIKKGWDEDRFSFREEEE